MKKWILFTFLQLITFSAAIAGTDFSISLQDILPRTGPSGSTGTAVTPFDPLGISNVLESYQMEYKTSVNNPNSRIASIFSTITAAPNVYKHDKVVTDRLAGCEVQEIRLIDINAHQFYAAKIYNPGTRKTDYAISFSVYETPSGFIVKNKWTHDEYIAPHHSLYVYNFQVWSSGYSFTIELVQSILQKFSLSGELTYMNERQFSPEIFFNSIFYRHTGKIILIINNTTSSSKNVNVTINYRYTQEANVYSTAKNYYVPVGLSSYQLDLGIIAEANILLSQDTSFQDEGYINGGIYTKIVGSQSTVTQFVTNTYPPQLLSNYPEGSSVLAGGARITGTLKDWVSVMRSLNAALVEYDLTGYNRIRFTANGPGVLTVLIDLTTTLDFNYHAYNINLTGEDKEYEIYFSLFKELYGTTHTPVDPSKIRMVAFSLSRQYNANLTSFSFEVKNIAFIPSSVSGTGKSEVPKEFALAQNYPNPFNPSTVIQFSVAKKEMLNLTIYNILGQPVMTLLNGEMEPGVHKIKVNASGLASGVYIYKLSGNSINVCKKMVITR